MVTKRKVKKKHRTESGDEIEVEVDDDELEPVEDKQKDEGIVAPGSPIGRPSNQSQLDTIEKEAAVCPDCARVAPRRCARHKANIPTT